MEVNSHVEAYTTSYRPSNDCVIRNSCFQCPPRDAAANIFLWDTSSAILLQDVVEE